MAKKVVVVIAVGLLGLLSFGAGFGAEVTKAKASDIAALSTFECEYPKTPALELGVTAAISLLVAQVILIAATGCFCCKRTGRSNCQLRVCCTVSWIAFFIAGRMLLSGAAINDGLVNGNNEPSFGYLQCYYVKPGVFAGGAVLSAISVVLGIFYYLGVSNLQNIDPNNPTGAAPNYDQGGIPMAQPQFPPHYNAKGPAFAQV